MAGRSQFAAPLLLAVFIALILYVSLYPFGFDAGGPPVIETLRRLTWARASRGDMFNNVLLYVPLGFCLALVLEPRMKRVGAILVAIFAGTLLSLTMEVLQASIAPRVPSLTDLTLNLVGTLAGAVGGSAWQALGPRMTPQAGSAGRSSAVVITIVVLWLLVRLWPLRPDASLAQLKRAVRPLFTPAIEWGELAAFFVGWLVVAQAVFHLARRQRAVDAFLLVIAGALVGRTLVAGHTLVFSELAALALLLPVLVLINRLGERSRSALLAAVVGAWLAVLALWPAFEAGRQVTAGMPALGQFLSRGAPPPAELAGKGFRYLALAWLLTGVGLQPRVAGGVTVLLVLLLVLLQAGVAAPEFGWIDLVIASIAAVMVARR
jgi:glycopeptide antibiotics resistance protein